MSKPDLTPYAQTLYDALAPLQNAEGDLDYPLAKYIAGLARPYDLLEQLARDSEQGDPGWSALLDPDRLATFWPEALPWLGALTGLGGIESIGPPTPDQIKALLRWRRGTRATMIAAAARTLTGTKRVIFNERFGSPWQLGVTTLMAETPDPAATLSALNSVSKPAGIILTHFVVSGGDDYATLGATYTYDQLPTTFTDYADIIT